MRFIRRFPSILVPVLALLVAACGGGSGPVLGGGISGTGKPGASLGEVVLDGGFRVAGTSYDTSGATVTIHGQAAAPTDVAPGQVALVTGVIDGAQGVAETVTVEDLVRGRLTEILDANRLRVQGQVIEVDDRTVYGPGIVPASPAGLQVGDVLEVYGFVRAPGVGVATRIEREDSLDVIRLAGFAQNVDDGAKTFDIGMQSIDYGMADVSDLMDGDPVEGQLVRVRGDAPLGVGGELVATRVRSFDFDDLPDNDETEVEGIVTAIVSASEFLVGDVRVRLQAGTAFRRGTAADLVVGARVEVEGTLAMGLLLAREVEFDEAVEIEADVDEVDGNTFTLVGLPGLTVEVNDLTEYEDLAGSLADIQPGDHVRVRGLSRGGSLVVATRVREDDADSDLRLQGPVDAAPAPSDPDLWILGVQIDTSGLPDGAFRGSDEQVIGRAAFFAALTTGRIVQVDGDRVGDVAVWDEIELEDEDD